MHKERETMKGIASVRNYDMFLKMILQNKLIIRSLRACALLIYTCRDFDIEDTPLEVIELFIC